MQKPLTHKEIATALQVSRPYVSRLVSLGMPTTSIADAKKWLSRQKKAAGTGKNTPISLNEGRLENILLKNRLLKLELEQAEDKSELVSVTRLEEALRATFSDFITSAQLAMQHAAEDLAAASTPLQAYRRLESFVMTSIFNALVSLFVSSKLKSDDPRLSSVVQETIRSTWSYTDEQLQGLVEEHIDLVMRCGGQLTGQTPMVSTELVDAAAARASDRIKDQLNRFVCASARRIAGGDTKDVSNLLSHHMGGALAEIQHEIALFRIEIGSPYVSAETVNAQTAEYWRNWARVCGVRAEILERKAAPTALEAQEQP